MAKKEKVMADKMELWERHNTDKGEFLWCKDKYICSLLYEPNENADKDANRDAKLIASAVNACISINPANPMAVAKNIYNAFNLLKSASLGIGIKREANKIFAAINKPAAGDKNEEESMDI